MVPLTGLEPVRLSAADFKSAASAYSAIGAYNFMYIDFRERGLNGKEGRFFVPSLIFYK